MVVAVVAGANGYIGGHLVDGLSNVFKVIALTRRGRPHSRRATDKENIQWIDLYDFSKLRNHHQCEPLVLFHCIGKSRESNSGDIFKANVEVTEYLSRSAFHQG